MKIEKHEKRSGARGGIRPAEGVFPEKEIVYFLPLTSEASAIVDVVLTRRSPGEGGLGWHSIPTQLKSTSDAGDANQKAGQSRPKNELNY